MSQEDNKPPLFFGERVIQNILLSGSFLAVLWVGNSVLELTNKVTILIERGQVLRADYDDTKRKLEDLTRKFDEFKYRAERSWLKGPLGGTSPVQFRPPTEDVQPRKPEENPGFRNDSGRR